MKDKSKVELKNGEKFIYAFGDVFGGGAQSLISVIYFVFLANIVGLGAGLAGTVVLIAKIWDAVSDPLMGVISDNTRGKTGRRKPYIFAGGIALFGVFLLMWLPIGHWESVSLKFVYSLLVYVLYSTVSTIIAVPYSSLSADITNDAKKRDATNVLRLVISTASTAVCTILPTLVLDAYTAGTINQTTFYYVIAIGFGVFFALPLILVGIFVKERVALPLTREKFHLKKFVQPIKVKGFRQLMYMYLAQSLAMDIMSNGIVLYALYCFVPKASSTVFLGIFIGVQLLMFPIINKLVGKIDKNKIYYMGLPISLIAIFFVAFYPATWNVIGAYAATAVLAIGFAGAQLTPWIIFPDAIDAGELQLGTRDTGSYSGIMTFIRKACSAVAIWIFGYVLELTGYVAPPYGVAYVDQPASAILGIRIAMCVGFFVFLLLAFFIARKFVLTKSNTLSVRKFLSFKADNVDLTDEDKLELAELEKTLGYVSSAVEPDVGMEVKMNVKCFRDIDKLAKGEKIDEAQIFELINFVNARYDCADFRLICLLKTYFAYRDNLSAECVSAIKECALNFKYWMDEPGTDGMCYWSENHQLLFAACELLAGQTFVNETFTNSNTTGKEHYEKAKVKILRWLKYKFEYGFIEWHSNTYYEEDIAPLCVLVDCCDNTEIVEKSKIALDLLFLDLAQHNFDGYFVASSGRCYEEQKKNPEKADVNDITAYAFGFGRGEYNYERLSAMYLLCGNYKVPQIIVDIANCRDKIKICDGMGFDLKTVAKEIPDASFDDRGMILWQMEAFTNPEAINSTIDIFNAWNLQQNNFLKDLKMINRKTLRRLNLLPTVSKMLNPVMNGVAIEKANVQTYKCEDYMLSTAQCYHPGEFGDQQHIWQASLKNGISVFSTNPACPAFDDPARNFSPSYWVGNGVNPFAFQNENVLLLGYNLKVRKGFMERGRQYKVHFYFPSQRFDEVREEPKAVYGKSGDGYIAILSATALTSKTEDELFFDGKVLNFAVVTGDKQTYGSFDGFVDMISNGVVAGDASHTQFEFCGVKYRANSAEGLNIDGDKVKTEYGLFETPFVKVKGGAGTDIIEIEKDGKKLILDFNKPGRTEING